MWYLSIPFLKVFQLFFDVAGAVWRRDRLAAHKFLCHSHNRLSVLPLALLVSVRGYDRGFCWLVPFDILIIAHCALFVKRFLKNIRSYFSVEFATSHLYKVLVPSIGCFLLSSSFLPFKIKRMNELLFAYQFPKPILFASFWHYYYSILCAVCQEVFQKFLNFFSRLMYEILPRQTSHFTAVTRLSPCPLDIIIIAYSVLFVKGFGKNFLTFFLLRHSWWGSYCPSPLDTIIISYNTGKSKMEYCTNNGILIGDFLCGISYWQKLGACVIIKNAPIRSWARRRKIKWKRGFIWRRGWCPYGSLCSCVFTRRWKNGKSGNLL